ncbi:hypothetical protein, partial [Vibrio cholerae]|uniref:hypothetical protein n=1 Tax=Vibrio cholerae TaxID=666 RepID=UPI00163BDE68
NKHNENLVSKYGSYSIEFDFAHDDYQTKSTIKGKEVIKTGGIDLRLKSISNLKSKGSGLTLLKVSSRKAHKSTQYINDTWEFFKEELAKLKVNRKYPNYYTGSIKHKASKRLLEQAATMIVEQVDSLLVFVVIGSVKYKFETKRDGEFTEKQTMAHSRFTAYNNSERNINWYEEDDFMLEDEFDLENEVSAPVQTSATNSNPNKTKRIMVMRTLAINYSVEPVTVQVTPKQASEIKEIIQDENAMTLQEAVNSFKRNFPEQYKNWLSISDESVLTKNWFLTKLNAHIENGKLKHPTSMLTSINRIYAQIQKAKKEYDEHKAVEDQYLNNMANQ